MVLQEDSFLLFSAKEKKKMPVTIWDNNIDFSTTTIEEKKIPS